MEQQSSGSLGMTALTGSLMEDPIPLFWSNNPTEHVNMKHNPARTYINTPGPQ